MRKEWLYVVLFLITLSTSPAVFAQGAGEGRTSTESNGGKLLPVVRGTVLSGEDKEPIIGATVFLQGTNRGTVTDIDGNFELRDIPSNSVLVISYVGMTPQKLTPKANMTVTLQTNSKQLGEVVVTGMQRMDKRMFTGASDQLVADDVKLSGLADVSRALEGRAAGVSVQNVSGTFGTAPKIRVRGATSINGSSKPLWVVDGVIMEDIVEVDADDLSSGDAKTLISSAIAGLNAEDIESFNILKDGSATSIYGARAMAGVIVITTRKGVAGQSKISYTGEFTYRAIPSYNQYNIMNSQDQMSVYREMHRKGWLNLAEVANDSESGVYGKMYNLISTGVFVQLANMT
jgi:TonB-dependent outer membrane receptor, SusC/RagA subfamily, signature region